VFPRTATDQQQLDLAPARPLAAKQARGDDLRVVQDEQVIRAEEAGEVVNTMVRWRAGPPIKDEEPGVVTRLDRLLGDEGFIERVVEVLQPHDGLSGR
jgi:hypothetical protein